LSYSTFIFSDNNEDNKLKGKEQKNMQYPIPLLWRGGENSEEFLTGWFPTVAISSPDCSGNPFLKKKIATESGK